VAATISKVRKSEFSGIFQFGRVSAGDSCLYRDSRMSYAIAEKSVQKSGRFFGPKLAR